jgi:hypothetical protein
MASAPDRLTGPEHLKVRLPTIEELHRLGWVEEQLQWRPEWAVPKTPSEATKRELGQKFTSFPADLVIFDDSSHAGEREHLLVLFEFKKPDLEAGRNQLEILLSLEPTARLGYWTNGLRIVRDQWNRVTFMQTNREDVGSRFLEIEIPVPPDLTAANRVSEPFRSYYRGTTELQEHLRKELQEGDAEHRFFVVDEAAAGGKSKLGS